MNTTRGSRALCDGGFAIACCLFMAWGSATAAMPACLDGVDPLIKADKFGEAIVHLDACPAESADDPQVLLSRGRALTGAGRLDDALLTFGRLVETQPKSASAWNNLAVVQAKLGRLPEARASLEKAVAIAPGFSLAQENLADVYVHLARADYGQVVASSDLESQERIRRKMATTSTVLARASSSEVAPGVLSALTFTQEDRDAVIAMVKGWAGEWSAGNWVGYRAYYDDEFKPVGDRPLAAWEAERRPRVAGRNDIRVRLAEIDMALKEEGMVEVRFVQSYSSTAFVERGRKVLRLVRRPAGWRIVREAFEPM